MDRSTQLRILRTPIKNAMEFNFDTLRVPPLYTYISYYDIQRLNSIAKSIRLSSKPDEKYKLIDDIMRPIGFVKMASGTNRVTYRCLNDYRVVLKIAIDRVGLSDSIREYQNQELLKPFVTKIFQVSPCGTVALVERVVPITSREEYLYMAEDVFNLLSNLLGKYVLDDVGEKYYMNMGVREGFGLVLLDYPYCYELDGDKLYCNKEGPQFENGFCGGEIDYDDGFNNLICTKCGKQYFARDLEKKKYNNEIMTMRGERNMKICFMRGEEVVREVKTPKDNIHRSKKIMSREEYSRLRSSVSDFYEGESDSATPVRKRERDTVSIKATVTRPNTKHHKHKKDDYQRDNNKKKYTPPKVEIKKEEIPVDEEKQKEDFAMKDFSTDDTGGLNYTVEENTAEYDTELLYAKIRKEYIDGGVKVDDGKDEVTLIIHDRKETETPPSRKEISDEY